ncbi:MAG: MFS transporter [Dehalococcoidales bacterium]|nr:MFS transporter [Dehalococcoidales bacterium]
MDNSWKKNLYAVVVAEFIVLIGFNFATPFLALYIQELGSFTNKEATLWTGIATGVSGIAMFFSSPFWGILADRWGRKPMLLRAQFGSAIVMALMAICPNIYIFIGLRFILGTLAGTVAAASALVATTTPRDKVPFAMGLIMVAMFTGQSFGPLIGGFVAHGFGYRAAFFVTAFLLTVGGLMVLLMVKEGFERPPAHTHASLRDVLSLVRSRQIASLLIVLFTLQAGPQMLAPTIPLFFKSIDPGGAAAASSGLTFFMIGLLAAISALVIGRFGNKLPLKKVLVFSCLGSSILYLPPIFAATTGQLFVFIGLTGLFTGGLMMSANALVALTVPPSRQGIAYGIAQSANALGGGLGPLIGGSLATIMGFRPVFGVTSGIFLLLSGFVAKSLFKPTEDKPVR